MAQEMGKGLGRRPVLFKKMQRDAQEPSEKLEAGCKPASPLLPHHAKVPKRREARQNAADRAREKCA
jgi:hypothetical protein